MPNPLRLVMMGTGPFAVPMFRALYDTPHQVLALVTQPLRVVHSHKKTLPHPMREVADERGTPILDPQNVNTQQPQAELAALRPDLFIVADYGQILSPETLAIARLGGVNLHASLLPKYRGAAPINWAIYHGERETGVTVIHMTPQIDAGPCLAQERTPIGPDETAIELEARLAQLGGSLVCRTIDQLETGKLEPIPQDRAQATKAPRLKKLDGAVDWNRPAEALRNQVRAMQPWPKTYTAWHRPGAAPMRLILEQVAIESNATGAAPSTVIAADKKQLLVAAGGDALSLSRVQPSGKRVMAIEEFLRGHSVLPGQQFGPEQ